MASNKYRTVYFLIFLLLFIPFFNQWGINELDQSAIDFPSFYAAVKLVFEHGVTPYAHDHWLQAKAIVPDSTVYSFFYLPQSLLLLFPIKFLPYQAAKNMMLLINHALVLLILYLLLFKIFRLGFFHPFSVLTALYLFGFNPLHETLSHGQVNLVVLVLICLALIATKQKKHPALAALCLTLAIFLKLYPALLLVYYMIKKDYKVILWAALIALVFTAAAVAILPGDIWADWYNNVFLLGGYGSDIHEVKAGVQENQSLHGFTSRLFLGAERVQTLISNPTLAVVVPYLLSGSILLLSCVILYRNRDCENADELGYALLLLVMVLVAPLSWNHHIVFVLPAILMALKQITSNDNIGIWLFIVILSALGLAFRIRFRIPAFRNGLSTLLISIKVYGLLLLWLYFTVKNWAVGSR